jgi:hypothetical protein
MARDPKTNEGKAMTARADFSDEEWEQVLEGPPSAGLMVSTAERGGTIREAFSIAKAYAEASKQHGGSELIDEVVNTRPEVDRTRHGSVEELREHSLTQLRQAVGILEAKASPDEVEDYRRFVVSVAEHVARAKKEDGAEVSAAEEAAIGDIKVAIGVRDQA